MKSLVVQPESDLPGVVSPPAPPSVVDDTPQSLLQAIVSLSRDPSVDPEKLERLLAMQERMEARSAAAEFTTALTRAQAEMPRVSKCGTIELGSGKGSIPFARWEDVDAVLRPIMDSHGFSLSFTAVERQGQGGGLVVTGILQHVGGHRETYSMPLGIDTGPGRNNLQAMGSSLSYGKRYLAEMIFNIVREGVDDDGKAGGTKYIDSDTAMQIEELITATGSDRTRFMAAFNIDSLLDLSASQAQQAINMLNQKAKKQG